MLKKACFQVMTWKHDFFRMTPWLYPLCTPIIWKPLKSYFQNRSCFLALLGLETAVHSGFACTKPPSRAVFMKNILQRGELFFGYSYCENKTCSTKNYGAILDHFPTKIFNSETFLFPTLFPKDFESLKNLEIWLWEVGAKLASKSSTWKGDKHTNIQTHGHRNY